MTAQMWHRAGSPLTMEHSGWKWRSLALTTAWSYRLGPRVQVWNPALLSVRLEWKAPRVLHATRVLLCDAELRFLRWPCSGWEHPTLAWCTTPVTAQQMPHLSSSAGKCAACMARTDECLP